MSKKGSGRLSLSGCPAQATYDMIATARASRRARVFGAFHLSCSRDRLSSILGSFNRAIGSHTEHNPPRVYLTQSCVVHITPAWANNDIDGNPFPIDLHRIVVFRKVWSAHWQNSR